MMCERCSAQVHIVEKCNYCNKQLCRDCEKSAKRVAKTRRYVICKDCWGDMKKRAQFKAE